MTDKKERIRRKDVGFVGVNLAKGGDMSIVKRLDGAVKETTMNVSIIIRLALIDWLDKRDKEK